MYLNTLDDDYTTRVMAWLQTPSGFYEMLNNLAQVFSFHWKKKKLPKDRFTCYQLQLNQQGWRQTLNKKIEKRKQTKFNNIYSLSNR